MVHNRKITGYCLLLGLFFSSNAWGAGMDHQLWDRLLQKHVKDGLVNYRAIKDNPQQLNQYLKQIADFPPKGLAELSPPAQIAFYINAYNAITVKRILDHYPPQREGISNFLNPSLSIKNISGVWNTIKDRVAGESLTLDDIEHKILRKKFKEPRVHIALVCASMSCPALPGRAFTADRLEEQLDKSSREFLADKSRNRLCVDCPEISLSKIFSWYGDDFVGVYKPSQHLIKRHGNKEASVITFIAPYFNEGIKNYLLKGDYDIDFLDYDWSLNEQK
jgi:hypothetical protein